MSCGITQGAAFPAAPQHTPAVAQFMNDALMAPQVASKVPSSTAVTVQPTGHAPISPHAPECSGAHAEML